MAEKRLNEMGTGEKGRVTEIAASGYLRQRVMDMGIVRGAKIEVVRNAPLGDPMEFLLKGYNLTLRKEDAANILLEVE
jgi:Fe2+ transport system protein FeoA